MKEDGIHLQCRGVDAESLIKDVNSRGDLNTIYLEGSRLPSVQGSALALEEVDTNLGSLKCVWGCSIHRLVLLGCVLHVAKEQQGRSRNKMPKYC